MGGEGALVGSVIIRSLISEKENKNMMTSSVEGEEKDEGSERRRNHKNRMIMNERKERRWKKQENK